MIVFRCVAVTAALTVANFVSGAKAEDIPELPPTADSVDSVLAQPETLPNDSVSVQLDLATVIRIPAGTDTLALGNPAIADVTQPRAGSFTVVTGKSYGTTNMLALDRSGQVLSEMMIHVKAPQDSTVTVQRGFARETWSCLPRCEQTVTLGDAQDYFGGSSGQIGSRNDLAGRR